MMPSRRDEIANQMHALRRTGAKVASEFPSDMKRAKDWREYVRAMPLPSVVAAASVGFGIMFARSSRPKRSSDLAALGTGAPGVMSAVPTRSRSMERESAEAHVNAAQTKGVLRTLFQTAGSWAAAYAVSQATQLAKQVAAQQLQTFKTGFGGDVHRGKKQRENGPFTESERGSAYAPFTSSPTNSI
jgi:hypothetical protein